MNQKSDEIEIDLREIFFVLKRRIFIILLVGIIFAVASGIFYSKSSSPVYQSTSKLYINTKPTSNKIQTNVQPSTFYIQDIIELIKSKPVVDGTIKNLNLNLQYEDMVNFIAVDNPEGTSIISINVQHSNSELASKLANELCEEAKNNIPNVISNIELSVAEVATASIHPVAANSNKNKIVIAFLFGLFISIFIITLHYVFNDKIKKTEDVVRYLNIDVLAEIPISNKKKGKNISIINGEIINE